MSDILDKIAKVLAKAEGTDNEHEADAFLQQAQRMATRYSIDLATARQHVAKTQQRETPVQRTIHVGTLRAVGNARFIALFLAVASANDVTCNIAHNSTYVIAFGFPSDIEVAEALYAHLMTQMGAAAATYLRSGTFREEAAWDPRTQTFKPVNAKAARLAFYDAFITRIAERLRDAKASAEAQAIAEDGQQDAPQDPQQEGPTGTALVLADKRAEVGAFYAKASTARGRWRGAQTPSARPASATNAGRDAGSKARLVAVPTLSHGKQALSHDRRSS